MIYNYVIYIYTYCIYLHLYVYTCAYALASSKWLVSAHWTDLNRLNSFWISPSLISFGDCCLHESLRHRKQVCTSCWPLWPFLPPPLCWCRMMNRHGCLVDMLWFAREFDKTLSRRMKETYFVWIMFGTGTDGTSSIWCKCHYRNWHVVNLLW